MGQTNQHDIFAPNELKETSPIGLDLLFIIIPGIAFLGLFSIILLLKYFGFF